jgi:DHA2 family multidrug resistance protein
VGSASSPLVVGLAQLVMSPFAPRIARRLDLRIMLSIGVAMFAVSMYLTAVLTNQTGFWELFVPQWVRGMGLMFLHVGQHDRTGHAGAGQNEERRRAL